MKSTIIILSILLCVTYCLGAFNPVEKKEITSLPGLSGPLSSKQYSGFINVNQTTGAHLFYWLVESQGSANDPFVVWLTGGPGCSSDLAYLTENGPYSVNPDLTLKENPYSWSTNNHVLYVDQPVGTGFSYLENGGPLSDGYVKNEKEMADEMYVFLQRFFSLFPQFANNDFFLVGESYSGHYLPSLATRINQGNKASGTQKIPLQGMAVGNGMVDPLNQYHSYGTYAYSHGLIDYALLQRIDKQYELCEKAINGGDFGAESAECNIILQWIMNAGGPFNEYDVTQTCIPSEPLCYNFTAPTDYLNLPSVQQTLGVQGKWNTCNMLVHYKIRKDWFIGERQEVANMLDNEKQRVLIYNGINDFIVNFMGSERWVRAMDWSHQQEFVNGNRTVWMVNGLIAGHALSSNGLTMLTVANAGHMVPMNVPKNALDMINKFTRNQPF
eukprot:CAMPEP_0201551920 /NCGR_PEP_ID=MMETSP0173_2-20130828/12139_1 /ASSEMBLY_ACC=CAM_ASM_000268 /TAXON_ID=218659 /ORGANISM="Vexillifera sp., Strain DIVA3 564/2" /LENGTH=441 /DNA_ID=CAMNT_0047962291 /DNA_START=38 /DNA_END=1363 /DNA_ORIENTATION=-